MHVLYVHVDACIEMLTPTYYNMHEAACLTHTYLNTYIQCIIFRYWTSVKIPHMSNEWTARCPFCSEALDPQKPAVKLLFS